jgi:hypothetical protein
MTGMFYFIAIFTHRVVSQKRCGARSVASRRYQIRGREVPAEAHTAFALATPMLSCQAAPGGDSPAKLASTPLPQGSLQNTWVIWKSGI